MAVKKPSELDFSDKRFMVIISGQPGLGKTTLALSAPKPFLFDTDNGVARVRAEHRCPTSTVSSYEELLEDMGSEEYKEAQTVVIDTGGTLVQLMKPWAKKQDSRAAKNGMAMFGVIKQEFDRLCYQTRSQDHKHLVVVFHTTEQVKDDTVRTRLSCEGSSKDIVWTPADFGGHMFTSGGNRMIGFTPTDEYFAKGCFGISGVLQVPLLQSEQPNVFLTNLFQAAQQQIAKWDAAARRFIGRCAGGQPQVPVTGELSAAGMDFVLYGVCDYVKAGLILDIKKVTRYEYGKYQHSPQHPMYLHLIPEADRFDYLIFDGSIIVAGPCGKDPEFKRVGQNSSRKCTVSLAVGKRDIPGQDRSETIWCNVVAWHGLAEVLADAQKGDPVFVIGRLQSREWEGKTYTDLVAEFVSVCAVASKSTAHRAGPAPGAMPPITDPEAPFQEFTTPDGELPF